jgi:DNA-binding NarL/FixJ family response regulator
VTHDRAYAACVRARLSPRQCLVIAHMARGLTVKEAAFRLQMREQTAKNVLARARRKMGASTTVELLAMLAWPEERAA